MAYMRGKLCGKSGVNGLVIPPVCWELTSLRVLASEWIYGVTVAENSACINTRHISIGVETFARMALDIGMVHADPHAGNFMVTNDGDSVCLLDFGMVIWIPPVHRRAWAKAIVHLVRRQHSE